MGSQELDVTASTSPPPPLTPSGMLLKSDKQTENDSKANLDLHKGIASEIILHG